MARLPSRSSLNGTNLRREECESSSSAVPCSAPSSAAGATLQATRKGPRDWRTVLMWISWGLAVAVAVGTVKKNAETRELEH